MGWCDGRDDVARGTRYYGSGDRQIGQMKTGEVSLAIDVFKPSTLPMARLAEYLKAMAALLGHESHVHLFAVSEGSAVCRASVDDHAAPKVEERLRGVVAGTAPKGALKARAEIDDLLLEDNAIGQLAVNGRSVIEFPGRMRAAQETIGPVRRDSPIEGHIYLIGGKDDTINVYLTDGQRESKCVVSVALAQQLGRYLRGPRLRLFGEGWWYRVDGTWQLKNFTAERFAVLEEQPLGETLLAIQETLAGIDPKEFWETVEELREG